VSGEVLGNLFEELLAMGAMDVAILPATMKKGLSAHVIKVIAKPEDTAKLARKIIIETGSLGVRVIPTRHRLMAVRRIESIKLRSKGRSMKLWSRLPRTPKVSCSIFLLSLRTAKKL